MLSLVGGIKDGRYCSLRTKLDANPECIAFSRVFADNVWRVTVHTVMSEVRLHVD